MKFYTNDGILLEDPYPRFEVEVVLGHNHRYQVVLPIVGEVPLVENNKVALIGWVRRRDEHYYVPQDGGFKVVRSKKSGKYLIVPGTPMDSPDTYLAIMSAIAGFRGDVKMVEEATTARILIKEGTRTRADAKMTVVALIAPGEQVVFYSTGRRENTYRVFRNSGGTLVIDDYTEEEYNAAAAAADDEYETV